MIKWKRKI